MPKACRPQPANFSPNFARPEPGSLPANTGDERPRPAGTEFPKALSTPKTRASEREIAPRDRYFDSDRSLYRYADGYIYQVDPTTRLIQAVIDAIV